MKILIISLAGIGDSLFATPLIEELKEAYPKSEIDVLVMWKGAKEVLENNPNVRRVIQYNMIKEGSLKSLLFCLRMRRKNYDLSITTMPQSKMVYRIVSFLIGARKKIGHIYDNYNLLDNFTLTKYIPIDYGFHCVENNLRLLKLLNREQKLDEPYKIYLSKQNRDRADRFIKEKKLGGKIIIGISSGTGSTKNLALRRWPVSYYIDLIGKILKHSKNFRVLLVSGPEELKENEFIQRKLSDKRVILVNESNINDAAAIVGKCDMFISVDNIMMHVAAAGKVKRQIVINTPCVNKTVLPFKNSFILVGKECPKNIGYRYNGKGILGRKEDIIGYMKSIKPEEVFTAIKKSLTK